MKRAPAGRVIALCHAGRGERRRARAAQTRRAVTSTAHPRVALSQARALTSVYCIRLYVPYVREQMEIERGSRTLNLNVIRHSNAMQYDTRGIYDDDGVANK